MALLLPPAWAQDPRGTIPPLGSETAPPPGASPRDTGVLTPPARPDFQADVAAAMASFKPAYTRKGSPRIALYWNRRLSDRLSQWHSTDRTLTTNKGVDITQGLDPGADKGGTRRFQESESGTTSQRMGQEGQRASPGDLWEWEFQNGFLDPFLRVGARIVDRTAILRITAARATSSIGRPQALDAQPVEVDALHGHADLFVEVLLSPSPQMPTGQEFLAVVKDVNTGQVLAHVNSRNAMHRLGPTRDYVATPRGFEPRDTPPPLRDLASNLAINVMDALGKFWAKDGPAASAPRAPAAGGAPAATPAVTARPTPPAQVPAAEVTSRGEFTFRVSYRVKGTASSVGLTYRNPQGGTVQMSARLPWAISFDARGGTFLHVAAQNEGADGSVTCEIEMEGETKTTSTSTGAYVVADCSNMAERR